MKKIALFVVAVAALVAFGAGTAKADRGFWFHSTAAGWTTYFNIQNTGAASQTATVTFYGLDGTSLGSTTSTIAANGQWNFTSGTIGNITTASLEAAVRGPVKITSTNAGEIKGYSTIADASFNGFNFSHAISE